MEIKTTKREMFEALITLATTGELKYAGAEADVVVSAEELEAFARNEIELLDKKAAKAKERAAAKRAEGDELTEAVFAALTDEYETIGDIAARVDAGEDVSTAKIQYRLRVLAEAGRAEKTEVSVSAGEGKKALKRVAYRVAQCDCAE